jgi:hypothetical protein
MIQQGPRHPSTQPSSWFGRNWKWVVPLGCFTAVAGFVAFVASIVLVVFGFVRSSDVYQHALETASSHPAVIEALGEPVAPGWYVTGSINVQGPSGSADISFPISGPRGKATVFAAAKKRAGRWDYEVLEVQVEGREERIDLRDEEGQ